MKYYVYCHFRKNQSKNEPFYIGKGSGKRCYAKSNRSEFWKRIVNKYGYSIHIIKKGITEKDAFDLEIETILHYKSIGYCEANFTNGGDGVRVLKRWWNDKISKAMEGIEKPSGIDNKSYKNVISKDELIELYVNQNKTTTQIAENLNITYGTVWARLKEYGIPRKSPGRQPVKIICINDGKIYNSINDAAKYYNVYRENISKVLKGKYKHTNKLTFKLLNPNEKVSRISIETKSTERTI
jgi:hypothetical protein